MRLVGLPAGVDAASLIAAAEAGVPWLVEVVDGFERWQVGEIVFSVPRLPDGWPSTVLNVLVTRRGAHLRGRCPGCGAVWCDVRPGEVEMMHAAGCVASDAAVRAVCGVSDD